MSAAPAAVQVRWREDVEQFVPAVPPTQQVANLRFVPATHSGDRGQFSPPERLIAVEERTPRRERQREVEVKRPPRFHSTCCAEERSSTSWFVVWFHGARTTTTTDGSAAAKGST